MGNVATIDRHTDLVPVLQTSLYPGASPDSIRMVLDYCRAAGLDPMQKPVHIVPMWDKNAGRMRDVIMPGIGLYRIQASRTGEFGGVSEPEFGPDITANIGGVEITYPEWCRVTARRILASGYVAESVGKERWLENYAIKGGKERSIAPNDMWRKRPYGQIAKCAEAQALRKAFPELGSAPTAEEMEGKHIDGVVEDVGIDASAAVDRLLACETMAELQEAFKAVWTEYPVSARSVLTGAKDQRKRELIAAQEDGNATAE